MSALSCRTCRMPFFLIYSIPNSTFNIPKIIQHNNNDDSNRNSFRMTKISKNNKYINKFK